MAGRGRASQLVIYRPPTGSGTVSFNRMVNTITFLFREALETGQLNQSRASKFL